MPDSSGTIGVVGGCGAGRERHEEEVGAGGAEAEAHRVVSLVRGLPVAKGLRVVRERRSVYVLACGMWANEVVRRGG